jgi:hypothetical protein
VGAVSHLALDALPHWGISDRHHAGRRLFLRVAAVDGLTMLAVMGWITATGTAAQAACAAGAVAPDMDKPAAELGLRIFPRAFDRLHAGLQRWEAPGRWPVDAAVAVGSLGLLAAARGQVGRR